MQLVDPGAPSATGLAVEAQADPARGQSLEQNAQLEFGEIVTDAAMGSAAEGKCCGLAAVRIESVGIGIDFRVTVGCHEHQLDHIVFADLRAVNLEIGGRDASHVHRRGHVP